ncbi:hypothetical protein C8Q80DRAFT_1129403 [Daedaleopsis nitida]|nr:hypothetical protein C8Q80DRAFT_1129403 [Daedaleopsis nitida]
MKPNQTAYQYGLEVSFGPTTKYHFSPATPSSTWTEVAVVDDTAPGVTLDGTPLVSNYDGAHSIYRAYMERYESPGGRRVLGLREVALKWVVGADRMAGVKREASLYDKQLRPLHGTVVPTFYGLYTGIIGDVEVGCIVLEWCAGAPVKDVFELNRQRMLAGLAIHNAGVRHGQIIDPAHYIPMDDGTLRIVGFSSAKAHNCISTVLLSKDMNGDQKPRQDCSELAALESRFGVQSDRLATQLNANVSLVHWQ